MTASFQLRPYAPADEDAAIALWQATWQQAYPAINCAARSCPPIRPEAYAGERVDAQLDDQVRKFVAGPAVRIESLDGKTIVHTTKIMDWFGEDFEKWGGGKIPFLRRDLPPEKARLLPRTGTVTVEYDDYDWSLNDWRR